jgi:flagellar biosynthesis protein FlhF
MISEAVSVAVEDELPDEPGQGDEIHTYRGRTLDEILPRIREELGADAVILREREGLVGGFGGFFAQRFVEVDARRGGPSINLYDDDGESELLVEAALESELPPEPGVDDVFARELQQAAAAWTEDEDQDDPDDQVEPAVFRRLELAPQPEPVAKSVKPRARRAPAKAKPAAKRPAAKSKPAAKPKPAAVAKPKAAAKPKPAAKRTPVKPGPAKATVKPRAALPPAPEPVLERPALPPAPQPVVERPALPRSPEVAQALARITAGTPARQLRANPGRRLPVAAAADLAVPPASATAFTRPVPVAPPAAAVPVQAHTATAPAVPVQAHAAAAAVRGGRLRRALASALSHSEAAGASRAKLAPGRPLDESRAATVAGELSRSGAGEAWVSGLIARAGAHAAPLAPSGDLRDGARALIARGIVSAPPLPATGAAVAFIGAGGSGKTACATALAAAYRRHSTLSVSVVTLGSGDCAETVAQRRNGGLVIVDTAAVTPGDSEAMQSLGAALAPLGLDAVYVALPTTLGPRAARRALSSFSKLRPTAVALTHADESDQLGVAVELATSHKIPLAYMHAGTNPDRALSLIDPADLARRLLP